MTQRFSRHWPRPDFLGRQQRLGTGMLLLIVGGVALLACGAWFERQQAELDRLSASRPTAAGSATSRRDAVVAVGVGDPEARRAAYRVAASLDVPWNELFASIEAATPAGVQWLRLEFAAAGGDLRLEGETDDTGTAVRVIDRLASQRSWRDVALVRWQRPEASAASSASTTSRSRSGVRFSIEASRESSSSIAPVVVSARQ